MVSDMRLRQDVEAELDWDAAVDSSKIGVAVSHGVVVLTGQVSSYIERRTAEEAAQSVAGVRAVANDLIVEVSADASRTDLDLAQAALNALQANVAIPADRIRVVLREGHLELQGQVSNWSQKRAAETAVASLRGVKGLTNNISIEPGAAPCDVQDKIEDALRRRAQLDARRIIVKAQNGCVTLEGEVANWQERNQAETAAWQAPGVCQVIDKLTIHP